MTIGPQSVETQFSAFKFMYDAFPLVTRAHCFSCYLWSTFVHCSPTLAAHHQPLLYVWLLIISWTAHVQYISQRLPRYSLSLCETIVCMHLLYPCRHRRCQENFLSAWYTGSPITQWPCPIILRRLPRYLSTFFFVHFPSAPWNPISQIDGPLETSLHIKQQFRAFRILNN